MLFFFFFFSSRRRHTRSDRDWSSDVCSSDLLPRARNRNWIAALLILVNQHGQQFGEFRFLRRKIFTLVKTQQFVRETFTFFVGVDDMRECTAQQFPVSFRVEIYRCRAHWFQAPLSYSACVNKYRTKTRWLP